MESQFGLKLKGISGSFFDVLTVCANTMTMAPAEDDYYCHYCACVYINKESTPHKVTGLTLRYCRTGAIYDARTKSEACISA